MASNDFDGKTDNHENDSSDTNGTSIIIDDDDPVVQEVSLLPPLSLSFSLLSLSLFLQIPIYLAKGLANNLYLLQVGTTRSN